tara:strand:+ start:1330 stop:1509 length:180 start_codon:yes stop_codon:yes gene_type:complete
MEEQMNDKEKAAKHEEILDIEGQKWLLMNPEMERWVESHTDMVEWMTEAVRFPPRSDCG